MATKVYQKFLAPMAERTKKTTNNLAVFRKEKEKSK